MKLLVTGVTGFIGRHLADRLVREHDVHLLLRTTSSTERLGELATTCQVHRHDGTTEDLVEIVGDVRPDVVVHLASNFVARHQTSDVGSLVDSNVRFGTQLLEAMSVAGVRRLVNTGTNWQHFENRENGPVCLYAATKTAFDAIVRYFVDAESFEVVNLKLFDTYGADDPRPKLLALLRRIAESGEHLGMSPGEQLIDLVHVDDVVEAFVAAVARLESGSVRGEETYAVSSGRPQPLRELVAEFEQITGRALDIGWGERPYRAREVMVPWNTGTAIPGWNPRVSFAEGVRRLLEADVRAA